MDLEVSELYATTHRLLASRPAPFVALVVGGWLVERVFALLPGSSLLDGLLLFVVQAALAVSCRLILEGKPTRAADVLAATLPPLPRFVVVGVVVTCGALFGASLLLAVPIAFLFTRLDALPSVALGKLKGVALPHFLHPSLAGAGAVVWLALAVAGLSILYGVCKVWYLAWLVPVMEAKHVGAFAASARLMRGRIGYFTTASLSLLGRAVVCAVVATILLAVVPSAIQEATLDALTLALTAYFVAWNVALYAQLRAALVRQTAGAAPTPTARGAN
jgi:hypothetical protein